MLAPSAVPFSDQFPMPKAMSKTDITDFKRDWVATIRRALTAGFDVIEIHNGITASLLAAKF